MFKKMPWWLVPGSYESRTMAIEAVRRWHDLGRERLDWSDEQMLEADWDPVGGTNIMRASMKLYFDCGFTRVGWEQRPLT